MFLIIDLKQYLLFSLLVRYDVYLYQILCI
jgi:hypothetical protein